MVRAPCEGNKLSGDPGSGSTTLTDARRALGAYLRHLRQRAEPSAEQRRARRRRAVGLRREEVAHDADISVTWYTWLEQGRPARVSDDTLRAIGRALRLSPTEFEHLRGLAAAAVSAATPWPPTTTASPSLQALVNAMGPHAAYAINERWDLLVWNHAATALLGDFHRSPGITDNVLRRVFLDPAWRQLLAEWDQVAASVTAQFRVHTAHRVGHPAWRQFVDDLLAESDAFRTCWQHHDVAPSETRRKLLRDAHGVSTAYLYTALAPDGEPDDVRVIVYLPG